MHYCNYSWGHKLGITAQTLITLSFRQLFSGLAYISQLPHFQARLSATPHVKSVSFPPHLARHKTSRPRRKCCQNNMRSARI